MNPPYGLLNFPSTPDYTYVDHQFNTFGELADWDWSTSGHLAPEALTDQDGGAITLGSGDATSGSYVQGQHIGSMIKLNRTGRLYEFLFAVQMDSASLGAGLFGACITNTNCYGTNVTDGLGFYATGDGYWNTFVAFDSTVQYTTYTQQAHVAAMTTNVAILGVKVLTDSQVVGAGSVSFWINGTQVGYTNSSSVAWLPYDELLRLTVASANSTAAARSCILSRASYLDQA